MQQRGERKLQNIATKDYDLSHSMENASLNKQKGLEYANSDGRRSDLINRERRHATKPRKAKLGKTRESKKKKRKRTVLSGFNHGDTQSLANYAINEIAK